MGRFDKVMQGDYAETSDRAPNADYWNRTEHNEGTEDEIAAYSHELRDS